MPVKGEVPAVARQPRRLRKVPLVRLTFLLPAILYLLIFYGYPLFYSLQISVEKYDLQAEILGSAPFVGLSNYIADMQDPTFKVLIGLGLAVFFYHRFPLSRLMRALFLVPWLLPLIVTGTVWKWLFNETNGLIDQVLAGMHLLPARFGWLTTPGWALTALIITNIWLGIPFNMAILYSGLQGISEEFYDAASIDGAGRWQKFWYVTLPLLEPVIGIVLMLGFIYTVKVFDIIYVMTQGGPANDTQTFATWSYTLSFQQQQFGQGAAQANMILIISLVVALFYLRWSRNSLEQ